jgi:N,N'-diacetyllegionaminate synthase
MLFRANKVFVIAEVAQAHDGSLGCAHSLIDAAAFCGADAVKFQTHIASAESTLDEPWRVRFSYQDSSRYDYWKRMEFSESHWLGLRCHAQEKLLKFGSSPFSIKAIELLTPVGVDFWKIASGEVLNPPVVNAIAERAEPVILSDGLSTVDEIDCAIKALRHPAREVALLHCTTAYPTPPEAIGLNLLSYLKGKFSCAVGLSDHSGKIFAGLAAVALGASVLEVHIAHSRHSFGPDVPASLTVEEFKQLVEGVRYLERVMSNQHEPRVRTEDIAVLRATFGRGIVPVQRIPIGGKLTSENLVCKKPMKGIPASAFQQILGRTVKRSISVDEPISWEDLEELTK